MPHRKHLTASPLGAMLSLATTWLYFLVIRSAEGFEFAAIFAVVLLHFTLLYILASIHQRNTLGEWMRGAMIGLNAGLNGILLYFFTQNIPLSGVISLILLLPAFLSVSRHPVCHAVLGWLNWFLPMSWLVTYPGLVIYLVNLMAAPLGYVYPVLRGLRVRLYVDLQTCSFTMYGGLIRPVKGFSGLNMGNFIFINPGWEHLLKHEIGHLFSLAALGFAFHYIGGIDENYIQENYKEAYAEYLAESYSTPGISTLSMWR
ncbi:MAG: hypothetical protein SF052_13665 [Bacteroidia bacterium]|nr:hypothetical protein [Bacteroidia bacterium]